MRSFIVLAALSGLWSEAALAQDVGDPDAGYEVATQICAACHAILPGEGRSPNPPPLPFEAGAPLPFEDIANTPGVTSTALFAWMGTSHPSMPNFVLEHDELRNIVAYILSLKRD
jgi:mono/diheme cytochrome c family protein